MKTAGLWRNILIVAVLFAGVFWLRAPTFRGNLWNIDEAIHAAAARTILDGGVLYRDAADIRNPLSYYAFAGIFAVCGENNLAAVRCFVALLIVATAFLLYAAGRTLRQELAGIAAALLYVVLSSAAFYEGDAYAANTEWFLAFFSSAAAAFFLGGGTTPSPRRVFGTGALLAGAFLSKQPALLEAAVPFGVLLYLGGTQSLPARTTVRRLLVLVGGWMAVVGPVVVYFWATGALRDALFYTWTYNLRYYGAEITAADRFASLFGPFQLLGASQAALVVVWAAGALAALYRLAQRQPTSIESATNPGLLYVALWTLLAWAGAASSGRTFGHYTIELLPAFCLGTGLVLGALANVVPRARPLPWRVLAAGVLAFLSWQVISTARHSLGRKLADDSSRPLANYIREHSTPADRIFVWGFHADIYLNSDRKPASRYLIGTFLTGMIPWTNSAPGIDTTYAIVPGTMDNLLRDLAARTPLFIVDCSAGPNRSWQKYPLDKFPELQQYVRKNYRRVEPARFQLQGYRLYERLQPGEAPDHADALSPLPSAVAAKLTLPMLAAPLTPAFAAAPNGADRLLVEGRVKYFMHAPAQLSYVVPAGAAALRGGFGIEPGAYAPDHVGPTDGTEFIIRWRPVGGTEQTLLRRWLRPREVPDDRPIQSFHVVLPSQAGGELDLIIGIGPADNAASDWSFWIDPVLENSP